MNRLQLLNIANADSRRTYYYSNEVDKLIAEKDALLREAALAMVHSRDNGFVYRDQFDLVINKINEAQAEEST